MCFFNSKVAREAGRLHRWWEKFWGRRYRAIPILDDDKLIERAAYLHLSP
jgi:membrane glycosyltransferase